MKKSLIRVVACAALLLAAEVQALEVAGVRVEDRVQLPGQTLLLNGAGLRKKLFFKVYVAALYLPERVSSALTIVNGEGPRRVTLRMLRDVDADTLVKSLREGLAANHAAAEMATLAPRIDELAAIMRGIGTAREGDLVGLDFSPAGVEVSFNGQLRGKVADGALARGLLKVWLGEQPVDGDLKKALLGG